MRLFKQKLLVISAILTFVVGMFPLLPSDTQAAESPCGGVDTSVAVFNESNNGALLGVFDDFASNHNPLGNNGESDGVSIYYLDNIPEGSVLRFKLMRGLGIDPYEEPSPSVEGGNSSQWNTSRRTYLQLETNTVTGDQDLTWQNNGWDTGGISRMEFTTLPIVPVNPPPYALDFAWVEFDRLEGNPYCPPEQSSGRSQLMIFLNYNDSPAFTCTVTPATANVNQGSETAYTINKTAQNGFNSPVTFTANVTPSGANAPTVSYTPGTNNQPPSTATIARVNTEATTPAVPYEIVFTGTASTGEIATCDTQLVVNSIAGDFNLIISHLPTPPPPPPDPRMVLIGDSVQYQVFAECLGSFNGPITAMTTRTDFVGLPSPTLGATELECGATTILTVIGTSSTSTGQQSILPTDIRPENVYVSGEGQL